MTYKTHTTFAVAVASPVAFLYYGEINEFFIIFMLALSVGSLAPDLDEEGSYLSRKIPIFPMIFGLFGVTHRGITHRLISVIALSATAFMLIATENITSLFGESIVFGFTLGYLLHLCGDMFTKGGINQFFYPVSKSKGVLLPRKFRFYTNSFTEMIVLILLVIATVSEYAYFTGLINV